MPKTGTYFFSVGDDNKPILTPVPPGTEMVDVSVID